MSKLVKNFGKKKMKNYNLGFLKESAQKSKKQMKTYHFFGSIPVYIKDDLMFYDEESDIQQVIDLVDKYVPHNLSRYVDVIYVGDFTSFTERSTNAAYKDGAIYVINVQDNAADMADDIVHELAHSLEIPYRDLIYGDGKLEQEFLGKRQRLFDLLKAYDHETMSPHFFLNPDYDEQFDEYLYSTVGYKDLSAIASGLFYSPYSITSLHEYFAKGFEAFFLHKDIKTLAKLCPVLYNKVEQLAEME